MARIVVTAAELQAASSKVTQSTQQIDGELARLAALVSHVAGIWEGDAHQAFQQVFEQWKRSARSLNDALGQISRALANSARNYDAAEQGSRMGFQS